MVTLDIKEPGDLIWNLIWNRIVLQLLLDGTRFEKNPCMLNQALDKKLTHQIYLDILNLGAYDLFDRLYISTYMYTCTVCVSIYLCK